MNKLYKTLKKRFKQFNDKFQYWWIICIYLFIPIVVILFFDKCITPLLQKYMIGVKLDNLIIYNSEYAVNNVINPFSKSMSIIVGFITSYFILIFFTKKLLKKKKCFIYTNKCIKFVESILILLAIIIAIYSKTNSFDRSQYGYNTETINKVINKEENVPYIPLEEIPSYHSIGRKVENELSIYNILLPMSQFVFYLSDNLEIIIAIAGAVIIPLKNYSEKIESIQDKEKYKNCKKQ